MKLTKESVGQRVRYHGPSDGPIAYDDHFRVVELYPAGAVLPNGGTSCRDWAKVDDRYILAMIPCDELSPLCEDCWCSACEVWG